MSITDSTTSLDTSWTEQSIVAFAAGTLSDSDEMITQVERKLQRGTLSTSSSPTLSAVTDWLVRGKEELMQLGSFTFGRRYAYGTLSEGGYRISLPPDYNGGHTRVKDQTNDRMLTFWPPHIFDLKYPDVDEETNGEPLICCIKNMELWVVPPANADTTLELEYERSGDDTTPTDFSFLPEIERWRCVDYALYEAFESLHQWKEAQYYEAKWMRGASRSKKANARRKWKTMGFQALHIFEDAGTRNYQS